MIMETRLSKRKQQESCEPCPKRFKYASLNRPALKTKKVSKSRRPTRPNKSKNNHKMKHVIKKSAKATKRKTLSKSFDLTDLKYGLDEDQQHQQPDSKKEIHDMRFFMRQSSFDIYRDYYENIIKKIKGSEGKEQKIIENEIKKRLKGVKFDVHDINDESYYHDVSNEVYIASVLLTFAIADATDGHETMGLVHNFLDFGADPRVENLMSGASAIGIALLDQSFVESFLQEITSDKYKFTEEKVDMAKSSVSNHLRVIWKYANEDKIMHFIKMLYGDTEDTVT